MIPTIHPAAALQPTPVWLRRFAKFVAAGTLFLIFAGAMVTSTGSGLAVPDWPLAYGMFFPPMVAGIFYEHGHRLIAGTVGFLTVIQAIWLQRSEPKRFVRQLGWWSLGAVVAQGLLGGLTVKLLLPHAVSIAHAGLAEIFLCLNVSIAFFTSESFLRLRTADRVAAAPRAAVLLPALVYLQILAGALVRHLGAGLAIPDFPLSMGRIVPAFATTAIAVNYLHRTGAALVSLTLLYVVFAMFRSGSSTLRRLAVLLLIVVSTQVYLGARFVWDGAANPANYHSLVGDAALHLAKVTSLHVVTGATLLAVSLLTALSVRTVAPGHERETATAFAREEVTA
jgi:cytochrome c oxidase assembly protein subunit 15